MTTLACSFCRTVIIRFLHGVTVYASEFIMHLSIAHSEMEAKTCNLNSILRSLILKSKINEVMR
jgi:hypothetical protein